MVQFSCLAAVDTHSESEAALPLDITVIVTATVNGVEMGGLLLQQVLHLHGNDILIQ